MKMMEQEQMQKRIEVLEEAVVLLLEDPTMLHDPGKKWYLLAKLYEDK